MLNIEKERDAFSKWHESEYGEHVTWWDDVPASHIHNDRWSGWKASALRAEKLEGCVVVPETEYNEMAQFKDLYKRAIVNAKKRKDQLNWAHVAGLGVGSTKAIELLKEFGIDPSATNMHAMVEAARGGNE